MANYLLKQSDIKCWNKYLFYPWLNLYDPSVFSRTSMIQPYLWFKPSIMKTMHSIAWILVRYHSITYFYESLFSQHVRDIVDLTKGIKQGCSCPVATRFKSFLLLLSWWDWTWVYHMVHFFPILSSLQQWQSLVSRSNSRPCGRGVCLWWKNLSLSDEAAVKVITISFIFISLFVCL